MEFHLAGFIESHLDTRVKIVRTVDPFTLGGRQSDRSWLPECRIVQYHYHSYDEKYSNGAR